jgi:hypothetical protein
MTFSVFHNIPKEKLSEEIIFGHNSPLLGSARLSRPSCSHMNFLMEPAEGKKNPRERKAGKMKNSVFQV